MKTWKSFVKRNIEWMILSAVLFFLHVLYLFLIGRTGDDLIYAGILDLCIITAAVCMAYIRYYRKVRYLKGILQQPFSGELKLPETEDLTEELLGQLAENANIERQLAVSAAARQQSEMKDYYAKWVHQIKTPIAAMRLTLQGEDTPAARRLTAELGRIEQYVDMVLTYLRLEEGGSDYVIRPCSVDEVVCAAVRRFAGEFIDRRIRLDYEPVQWETVTDGKWLTFVVEQLLSNALKYTGQEGVIRIYRQGDELCIADTGIGIAPEDLPRVFQMGYTGQNGRLDRRSSGIGLYLCRRICGNLRHGIRMESVPGKGTTVYLTLGRGDFLPE